MDRIAIETTTVAVLADGATPSMVSNARGHLLEAFVAKLLAVQGYGDARTENLNVTSEGVEIDVEASHTVTRDRIICECKAYSTHIGVPLLTSFLGKFAMEKADDPTCHGLFVGLPRLTSNATEKARVAESKLQGFRYLGSYEVCELLAASGIIPRMQDGPPLAADPTLVVTEHGFALAAKELDAASRKALRWAVWARSAVPAPLVDLVDRYLSDALPVVALGRDEGVIQARVPAPSTIVEVKGSSSDFEYQLPAAPQFFVGRKAVAADLRQRVSTRTHAGTIVINAKSGWGKSSLLLRLQREVERLGGVSLIVDTRTAQRTDFPAAAIELLIQNAAHRGLLTLSEGAAFTSVNSIVETLRSATWQSPKRPLLIAFDQFENVFRDFDLTREFRDLVFAVREVDGPLSVAFSWKTDMVGLTEDHPYKLRDQIRDSSHVAMLEPFGARDVETLLRRLEKAVGEKLNRELRQRLREYSQGLPWLFKKLAAHIFGEVSRGITQEQLVRESLNVQVLFEADLSRLTPAEQEALHTIARSAPVLVSELDDSSISGPLLESLLHQRLVVQVGDRLDIYWDTFRDFLNTGRVAIEDSYVLRYAPLGPGRLLRVVMEAGGDIGVPEAAQELDTSPTVIFNYSRELRLFGVLVGEANRLLVDTDILSAEDPEEAIRARVARALRRHKMHTLAMNMIGGGESVVPIRRFAEALPSEFPTIEAKPDSWFTYARSFCQWMEYAGLVEVRRDGMVRAEDFGITPPGRLLSGAVSVRVRSAFPGSNPGPAIKLLQHLASPAAFNRPPDRALRGAVRDLSLLGAIELDARDRITLADADLMRGTEIKTRRLRELVESQRGMEDLLARLEADPACSPMTIGAAQREMLGADWADSTTLSVGKFVRGWARACGIETKVRPKRGKAA